MARTVEMKFDNNWALQVLNSSRMRSLVLQSANEVASRARATAPRGRGPRGGAYARSIQVEMRQRDRPVGVIISRDPGALAIEARTGNLARALRAARRGR